VERDFYVVRRSGFYRANHHIFGQRVVYQPGNVGKLKAVELPSQKVKAGSTHTAQRKASQGSVGSGRVILDILLAGKDSDAVMCHAGSPFGSLNRDVG